MRITDLRLDTDADWQTLGATVHWEACGRPPQEIHFRVPAGEFRLSRHINPFLLSAAVPAMAAGEPRIHCEDPIDPVIAEGLPSTLAILAHWCRDISGAWCLPQIEGPIGSLPGGLDRATATLYSGGVDASFTLLRNHQMVPIGDAGRIRHALLVYGLDMGFREGVDEQDTFEEFVGEARAFLARRGVTAIPVWTNLRSLDSRTGFWGRVYVGTALSAIVQLFPEHTHQVMIGTSAEPLGDSVQLPWGTHPMLHSYLGSSAVQSRSPYVEWTRLERIRLLAEDAEMLASLRVCFSSRTGRLNCGRCEKCVRTRLALLAVGADPSPAFSEPPLTPALVDGIRIGSRPGQLIHEEIRAALDAAGHGDFVAAEDRLLARWRSFDRWRSGAGFKGWLKRQDARWLGGGLTRVLQGTKGGSENAH